QNSYFPYQEFYYLFSQHFLAHIEIDWIRVTQGATVMFKDATDYDKTLTPIGVIDKEIAPTTITTNPANADEDNDGLNDGVEVAMYNDGARPDKKDIFVEVDWMGDNSHWDWGWAPVLGVSWGYWYYPDPAHKMSEDAKKKVKTAFAKHGIELHIVESEELEHDDSVYFVNDADRDDDFYDKYKGHDLLDLDTRIVRHFNPNRFHIFHYALIGHRIEDGPAALSEISGDDFVLGDKRIREIMTAAALVSLLGIPWDIAVAVVFRDYATLQAGVFMHELGHHFSLNRDKEGYKGFNPGGPVTCMNYFYAPSTVDYHSGEWNTVLAHLGDFVYADD
ncbi:MAG: hypothetical protein AB1779_06890, partial [Candidatus Thermoplasmatota archaeon]